MTVVVGRGKVSIRVAIHCSLTLPDTHKVCECQERLEPAIEVAKVDGSDDKGDE